MINYSICDKFRGKGLGTKIINYGISKISIPKNKTKEIHAHVKKSNHASINIFRKLKFTENENSNEFIFKLII